ncbi:hypothetical protein DL764_002484 [Monosporascus ibericus]|uniref:Uncharacterized protein n=1 Tax=Monosporascus ibericus TaxID=155417 RepID=A0A4Q4TNL0_9PEZI|nr:hypothetical protein DL764_002484 [Monosporascus ibericus]
MAQARSAKTTSSGWTPDEPENLPRTPIDSPPPPTTTKPRQLPPLASPYLNEQAHVQSLQQPNLYLPRRTSSTDNESMLSLMEQTGPKPQVSPNCAVAGPLLSPSASELAHVKSLQRHPPLLGKPSSESFTTAVTRPDDESVPEIRTSSPVSSRRQSGASALCNPQRRSEETTKSSQPGLGVEEAKLKQYFIKRLRFESWPHWYLIWTGRKRRKPAPKPEKASPTSRACLPPGNDPCSPTANSEQPPRLSARGRKRELGVRAAAPQAVQQGHLTPQGVSGLQHKPFGLDARRTQRGIAGRYVEFGIRTLSGRPTDSDFTAESLPWSSVFPGGEARRVKTPPLREGTAGDPRSFFFLDISALSGGANSAKSQQDSHGSSSSEDRRKQQREAPPAPRAPTPQHAPQASGSPDQHRALRRARPLSEHASGGILRLTGAATTQTTQMRAQREVPVLVPSCEDMAPSAFKFDLPEHLPSSPMCPANKKHKSGGTGVRVYHGRRKRSSEVVGGEADDNRGRVGIGSDLLK